MSSSPSAFSDRSLDKRQIPTLLRAFLVLALLYLFLTGVELLGGGFKSLGKDLVDGLFEGVSNPIGGLFVGLLATVLVQSSSVSTSVIVGLVAAGVVNTGDAVPMIMGANLGTTVTNTLASGSYTHLRAPETKATLRRRILH